MIKYVIPENIDDRILTEAADLLKKGKVVCFPTDTNWVFAVDPFISKALDQLYLIKKETTSKHFSLLCSGLGMASDLVSISNSAFKLIKPHIPGNYTFIFEASKKLQKAVKASKTDKEAGVRLPDAAICQSLIQFYGNALASTNVTPEMVMVNSQSEIYSFLIDDTLGHICPLTIDPGEVEFAGPSTIYSFVDGTAELVREGAGQLLF